MVELIVIEVMKHRVDWNNICLTAKKNIHQDVEAGNLNLALKKIRSVLNIEINSSIYRDDELESILLKISDILFPEECLFHPIQGNYVFCDSMMWDDHGLTQQYLSAIMNMGVNILYIKTELSDHPSEEIQSMLDKYEKASVIKISKDTDFVKSIQLIYNSIVEYRPEKIFIHSFSCLDVVVLNKIASSIRYRINLGSHLTWVGINCTDIMLEFDDFGYTVSLEKRCFPKNKMFKLPFYPVLDSHCFEGFDFPLQEGAVLMFTGGASYKIKDKNDTFLNIIKKLIENNNSLIVLIALRGNNEYVSKFILKNNLYGRLINLSYRKDINQVFKHIDIFLQTYPTVGGLMLKYAMLNRKPVLSFVLKESFESYSKIDDKPVDFGDRTYRLAYTNLEEFHEEAKKLIEDRVYRESIGNVLGDCALDELKFNDEFKRIILGDSELNFKFSKLSLDYDVLDKRFSDSEETRESIYFATLLRSYGLNFLFLFYPLFLFRFNDVLNTIWRYLKNKYVLG